MSDNVKNISLNMDHNGNRRGKCKSVECDCDEFTRSKDGICSMCGCYPGKHEKLDGAMVMPPLASKLPGLPVQAINPLASTLRAVGPLAKLTPSKIAELDIETGEVIIHSKHKIEKALKNFSTFEFGELQDATEDLGSGRPSEKEVHADQVPEVIKEGLHDDRQSSEEANDNQEKLEENSIGKGKQIVPNLERDNKKRPPRFVSSQIKKDFISFDLKRKLSEENGMIIHEDAFVMEAASYLTALLLGCDNPTQVEYEMFCERIVEFYPALQCNIGKKKWAVFKTVLSRHLAQRRYRAKNKPPSRSKSPKTVRSCRFVYNDDPTDDEETINKKIEILKGTTSSTSLSEEEVLSLIRSTSAARRASVRISGNTSPKEMVEVWPHLLVVDWLIYDFFTFAGIEQDAYEKNAMLFLRRLTEMQGEEESERAFIENLHRLSVEMAGSRKSKKMINIITVIDMLGELHSLTPLDTESPRVVISYGGNSESQCYLIYDANRSEVKEPSATRILKALMAAYYVFDVRYPPPYSNFLTILDRELLKKNICTKSSQRVLSNFYKRFSSKDVKLF